METAYSGCLDRLGDNGKVIEALFDEQTDDAVGVEEEVASASVFVPDDGVQGLQLRGMREREDRGRERCRGGLGGRRGFDDHDDKMGRGRQKETGGGVRERWGRGRGESGGEGRTEERIYTAKSFYRGLRRELDRDIASTTLYTH